MKKLGIAVIMMLAAGAALAAPIVETWTSGTGNWGISGTTNTPADNLSSIDAYGTISQDSGSLLIAGDSLGDAQNREDFISADTSSMLAGDYFTLLGGSRVTQISFDFYANADPTGTINNDLPNDLRLYLVGGLPGSSFTWYYDLTLVGPANSWQYYSVGSFLSTPGGWYREVGGPTIDDAAFQASLQSVTEIGIWLSYVANLPSQEYRLDDFTLSQQVPEPSTWAALGMALTSVAMTFRKRVNASFLRFLSFFRS